MVRDRATTILAAATAIAMVCYGGSGLWSRSQAVQIEEIPSTQGNVLVELPSREPETVPESEEPTALDVSEELTRTMAGMDGKCIFVYDAAGGNILSCNTSREEKLYPASITKLYTAWLALQYLEPDMVVTAGEELALVGSGSSLAYISRGCRLRVDMLVEAMLLPSGNDAAYVLAAAAGRVIAGEEGLEATVAVQRFVAEMNREGERLGFVNSHFANPDGYHTGSHYSCPEDMARIGELAMENDTITGYTALEADTVTYVSGERITWYNTNRLINKAADQYCPQAVGLKTGYTGESGYCLLAAFRDGEKRILVGIFGAEKNLPRYENAVALWQCCGMGQS